MLIMLKQRKTFLGLFFPMSNRRIPGVDFDIIICLLPKTFTGSNIFLKNFGKKYCLTYLDECLLHSNNNKVWTILK